MASVGVCWSRAARLAVPVILALGCGAGDGPAVPDLLGAWQWTETSGGVGGESRTPRPDDPRITVRFEVDGTAVFHSDGEVARQQRYRIFDEVTVLGPEKRPVLYFDDEDVGRVVQIDPAGPTLTLSDNVYDGYSLHYIRVPE